MVLVSNNPWTHVEDSYFYVSELLQEQIGFRDRTILNGPKLNLVIQNVSAKFVLSCPDL